MGAIFDLFKRNEGKKLFQAKCPKNVPCLLWSQCLPLRCLAGGYII